MREAIGDNFKASFKAEQSWKNFLTGYSQLRISRPVIKGEKEREKERLDERGVEKRGRRGRKEIICYTVGDEPLERDVKIVDGPGGNINEIKMKHGLVYRFWYDD